MANQRGRLPREPIAIWALALVAGAAPFPAFAQHEPTANPPPPPAITAATSEPEETFSVVGSVTLATDYRYRGISYSDGHPTAQVIVNVVHKSGFYAGAFASSLDISRNRSPFGAIETDFWIGYTKEIAPGTVIDGAILYFYAPDAANGADTDYFEPYATISQQIGPVNIRLGAEFAWDQKALIDKTLYVYGHLGAAIPKTPLSVAARLGHNDLGSGFTHWEWQLGLNAAFGPWVAGLTYVDTDVEGIRDFEAALVFSLAYNF